MWAAAWYECSEMRGSVVFTGARLGNRQNKRGNRALAQLPHPPSTSHSSHCFGLASGLAEPCRCERRMPFYARHHSCEQLNRRAYPAEGATNGAGMLLHALKGAKPTCSTIAVFLVQKNLVLVILRSACDRLRRMHVLHNLFAIFFWWQSARPPRHYGHSFNLETAVGHVRMGRHGDVLGRRDNAAGYCPQGGATPPARPRAAQSGV